MPDVIHVPLTAFQQARFKSIPNSAAKTAVWLQHQDSLKAAAALQHMPEIPAFPSTKVAA